MKFRIVFVHRQYSLFPVCCQVEPAEFSPAPQAVTAHPSIPNSRLPFSVVASSTSCVVRPLIWPLIYPRGFAGQKCQQGTAVGVSLAQLAHRTEGLHDGDRDGCIVGLVLEVVVGDDRQEAVGHDAVLAQFLGADVSQVNNSGLGHAVGAGEDSTVVSYLFFLAF